MSQVYYKTDETLSKWALSRGLQQLSSLSNGLAPTLSSIGHFIPLYLPNSPKLASLLFYSVYITPDDFTRQWRACVWERVNWAYLNISPHPFPSQTGPKPPLYYCTLSNARRFKGELLGGKVLNIFYFYFYFNLLLERQIYYLKDTPHDIVSAYDKCIRHTDLWKQFLKRHVKSLAGCVATWQKLMACPMACITKQTEFLKICMYQQDNANYLS